MYATRNKKWRWQHSLILNDKFHTKPSQYIVCSREGWSPLDTNTRVPRRFDKEHIYGAEPLHRWRCQCGEKYFQFDTGDVPRWRNQLDTLARLIEESRQYQRSLAQSLTGLLQDELKRIAKTTDAWILTSEGSQKCWWVLCHMMCLVILPQKVDFVHGTVVDVVPKIEHHGVQEHAYRKPRRDVWYLVSVIRRETNQSWA